MRVKQKSLGYEAHQFDGDTKAIVVDAINGVKIEPGPGGMKIIDKDRIARSIEAGSWAIYDSKGNVIEVISDADFITKFEVI